MPAWLFGERYFSCLKGIKFSLTREKKKEEKGQRGGAAENVFGGFDVEGPAVLLASVQDGTVIPHQAETLHVPFLPSLRSFTILRNEVYSQ